MMISSYDPLNHNETQSKHGKSLSKDRNINKQSISNHSPTSSTSSGPDTPNSKTDITALQGLITTDQPNHKEHLNNEINSLMPIHSINKKNSNQNNTSLLLDSMETSYDLDNEMEPLPSTFVNINNPNQSLNNDPIIKLKIRYVAKDLWQTLSFPTSITVSQARDICLLRCNIWNPNGKDNNNNNNNNLILKSNSSIHSDELSTTSDETNPITNNIKEKNLTKRLSMQNEQFESNWRGDYSLFWNGAGHWLDDFRRLDSYNLRSLDILELQKKSDFIFIQPSLYHEHYAEGYMLKLKGGLSPSWKLRWFVVQGRGIWYFRKKKDSTPAGSADLSKPFQVQETSIDVPGHSDIKESCLILRYSEKCWWLRGTSVDELDHWRRILITLNREVNDHCAAQQSQVQSNLNKIGNPIARTISNTFSETTASENDLRTQHSFISKHTTSTEATGTRGSMRIKAGYMYRRTPITHNFRERYFVLRGKELSCYKSDRFDKAKNVAQVISLHTVEISYYSIQGKYYFRISDKTAGDEEPGIVTASGKKKAPSSRKGSDFKSILSSTKSLPNKVGNWISQSNGAQLKTEYLYVESREDSESWKNAFENISELEVIEIDPNNLGKNYKIKSGSRSINTTKTNSSFWSSLTGGKSFPKLSFKRSNNSTEGKNLKIKDINIKSDDEDEDLPPVNNRHSQILPDNNGNRGKNRFSQFLKSRNQEDTSPKGISNLNLPPYLMATISSATNPNNNYDNIDDIVIPSTSDLSLGLSNIEQEELNLDSSRSIISKASHTPSLLVEQPNNGESTLTPLDKLLAEDYKERERMLSMRTHHPGMIVPKMAQDNMSGHSSTPSSHSNSLTSNPNDPNHVVLRQKSSNKFIWFKKKSKN